LFSRFDVDEQKQMEGKIFFSYSRFDASFALKLAKDLRAANLSVWIDQMDIPPGAQWDLTVEEALRACVAVLVILSPKAVGSRSVMDEVSFALDGNRKILPVVYKTCEIPFRLRRLQQVDFTSDYSTGLLALTKAFELSPGPTLEPPPLPPAEPPEPPGPPVGPTRLRSSLWSGLVGGVVSVAFNLQVYAHDPRRYSRGNAMDETAVFGGIFAGLLWAAVGAIAGPSRSSLASAVITSLVVLGVWVGVAGTYSDVLWTAVTFGLPVSGIVAALVSRWILKRRVSS
jgi:hypothetical protein